MFTSMTIAFVSLCGAVPAEAATSRPADAPAARERVLRKEVEVRSTPEKIWHAWTTAEGLATFFSPKSRVELRVGGPYELMLGYPDARGKSGSEGCEVLAFCPGDMLAFEWNFPPAVDKLRAANAKTQVVLRFDDLGDGRVRVRLAQHGWQDGPDWDAGYTYFDKAWGWVLGQLKAKYDLPEPADEAVVKQNRVFRTAPEGASKESRLRPLERLIGTWEARSAEGDGGEFHVRMAYEWSLGGKVILGHSFVMKDGQPQRVYETIIGWHPGKQEIVFQSYSLWDSLYDGELEIDGDTVRFEWDGFSKDKTTRYRQTIRFLDDDRYEWTVFTRMASGWEQSKQMVVHRVAEPRSGGQ